jgi:hypothetical protein
MATKTVVLGILVDNNNNRATLSFDYDDVTLLMSAVKVDNQTNKSVFISASRIDGSKTYSATVAAGQTTSMPIGATTAQKLQLVVIPPGKLDGVDYQFYFL